MLQLQDGAPTALRQSHRLRLPEVAQLLATVIVAASVAIVAFLIHVNLSTAGSLELLLVVLVALRWGFIHATATSISALLSLNYLFTAPLFHFAVADSENLISLAVFETTALLVSRLSSEARLHAAAVELERKRNYKLYELSRAILLIDVRASAVAQVADLIRDLIEVEFVDLWSVYDFDDPTATLPQPAIKGSAYETFLHGENIDNPILHLTQRPLRSGTTTIGGLVLRGWNADPPLADAVASLVAIALERARASANETRAEAERKIEQLRTAVLDGLAHGYKTPLTAIQTASSGLLAIRHLSPTQTELVSIIDEQATVLSQLTTRLLRTAALEGKQVKLRRQRVQISRMIADVINEQEESIQPRVQVDTPPALREIMVDADLIKLALTQLIDNAAKYSVVDGPIQLSITQDPDQTVIVVANHGVAIAPAERLRVFQRFYRGLSSTHGPTGTGLGLSIVKKFAEAHDGRAWVDYHNGMNRFSVSIPNYKGVAGE